MNIFTNITIYTTLLLYVVYSIITRFNLSSFLLTVILYLVVINIVMIGYSVYRDYKSKHNVISFKYSVNTIIRLLCNALLMMLIDGN